MVPFHPCQLYSKPTKIDDVISHENYVIVKAFDLTQLFLLYLVFAQSCLSKALTKRSM